MSGDGSECASFILNMLELFQSDDYGMNFNSSKQSIGSSARTLTVDLLEDLQGEVFLPLFGGTRQTG